MTDKTGTLTKNEMNVFKYLTVRKEIVFEETIEMENGIDLNKKNNNKDFSEKKVRVKNILIMKIIGINCV